MGEGGTAGQSEDVGRAVCDAGDGGRHISGGRKGVGGVPGGVHHLRLGAVGPRLLDVRPCTLAAESSRCLQAAEPAVVHGQAPKQSRQHNTGTEL